MLDSVLGKVQAFLPTESPPSFSLGLSHTSISHGDRFYGMMIWRLGGVRLVLNSLRIRIDACHIMPAIGDLHAPIDSSIDNLIKTTRLCSSDDVFFVGIAWMDKMGAIRIPF